MKTTPPWSDDNELGLASTTRAAIVRQLEYVLASLFLDIDGFSSAFRARLCTRTLEVMGQVVCGNNNKKKTRSAVDMRDFPLWMLVLGLVTRTEMRCVFHFRACPPTKGKWRQLLIAQFSRLVRGTRAASFRLLFYRGGRRQFLHIDVCFAPDGSCRHRAKRVSEIGTPPFHGALALGRKRFITRLRTQELWIMNQLFRNGHSLVQLVSEKSDENDTSSTALQLN